MAITDPRDIPGLLVWYSADHEATLRADGAPITTSWTDLSGNGNDAPAHVSDVRSPLIQHTTGPGGGPAVSFHDGSGYFEVPAVRSGAVPGEIHTSVKCGPTAGSNYGLWNFGNFSAGSFQTVHRPADIQETAGMDPWSQRKVWTSASTLTQWHTYDVRAGTGDWKARVNGVVEASSTTVTIGWDPTPVIGVCQTSAGVYGARFDGLMSYFLLFDHVLTTTERADLDAWVAANPSGGTTAAAAPVDVTVAGVLPAVVSTLTLTSELAAVDVSLAGSLPAVTSTISAKVGVGVEAVGILPRVVSTLTLTSELAPAEITVTGVLPLPEASFTLSTLELFTAPENRTSGRPNRAQAASWTWEPPVEPRPVTAATVMAGDTAIAFDSPVVTNGRPVVNVVKAFKQRDRHRILVRNRDVTFFRGVPTPEIDYQLLEPLMYGAAFLTLPQVVAWCEAPGEGDLSWLRPGAVVKQQRVDADGNVTATDYKGFVLGFDTSGADLRVDLGGEVVGRAANRLKQIPLFRKTRDIGRAMYDGVNQLGARFRPRLGPETGIEIIEFGGTSHLDYLNRLHALAWDRTGNQWTTMPDDEGAYRMARKDTTTIHATIYAHDEQTPANLRRDLAEEPNRIYGTGVTHRGMRVLNGAYPGLLQGPAAPYPFTDGRLFGEGTTDADTDTGDGISVMTLHLQVFGYILREERSGAYDDDVVDAVEALQADAGLTVTGTMTVKTWAALYDLDATGFSHRLSRILPMAQDPATQRWRRTASGAVIGRNANYDPHKLVVDRNLDFGNGFEKRQMREWSRAELNQSADNWVGTITLETGAVVAGDHTPGTPIAEADVMAAQDVRPGMNVSLPLFMGGIVAHVSGVSRSGGKTILTVDTRARDALPVWEVIKRNRETRRDPHRAWQRDHLASGLVRDAITEWSEVGGLLGTDVTVRAHEWTLLEVPSGRAGTVHRIRIETDAPAEISLAVCGDRITTGKLTHLIGNPFTAAGRDNWDEHSEQLERENLLLYVAGDGDQPGGYFPRRKFNDAGESTGAPLTGVWQDDAGFGYSVGNANMLRVAVYCDRDTTILGGRIMWPQLDPA